MVSLNSANKSFAHGIHHEICWRRKNTASFHLVDVKECASRFLSPSINIEELLQCCHPSTKTLVNNLKWILSRMNNYKNKIVHAAIISWKSRKRCNGIHIKWPTLLNILKAIRQWIYDIYTWTNISLHFILEYMKYLFVSFLIYTS